MRNQLRNAGLPVFLLVLLFACQKTATTSMTVDTLKSILDAGEPLKLIDVRTESEYTGSLGHIRGAELMPLADIEQWSASLNHSGLPIVVICRSGNRSGQAQKILAEKGIHSINLTGGMINWNKMGYPVIKSGGENES